MAAAPAIESLPAVHPTVVRRCADAAALADCCAENPARCKVPGAIVPVGALPRTTIGKIDKQARSGRAVEGERGS